MNKAPNLFKRFFWRVSIGAAFTIVAFAVMQPLAVATGVPEVASVLPALAVLYWLDLSLLIGRVLLSPQLDAQQIMQAAVTHEPGGAKYISTLLWLQIQLRLGLLIWLIYVL
jgi:hypothetical protein